MGSDVSVSDDELVAAFLGGMSAVAATVCVVATDGPAGRGGVTVTAFSSVSAAPPTVMACVHHLSPVADLIKQNGSFCLNVLHNKQSYVSDAFAGRLKEHYADRFDCGRWRDLGTGAPALEDALVNFDCLVAFHKRWDTHEVFFGTVKAVVSQPGKSLLYANRGYAAPMKSDEVDDLVPWTALQGW